MKTDQEILNNGLKEVEKEIKRRLEIVKKIADYIKMIDPAVTYEIEDTEEELVVDFYTFGFDGFMLSKIQSIARENGFKADFCVESYSQKAIRLTIILSRGE